MCSGTSLLPAPARQIPAPGGERGWLGRGLSLSAAVSLIHLVPWVRHVHCARAGVRVAAVTEL